MSEIVVPTAQLGLGYDLVILYTQGQLKSYRVYDDAVEAVEGGIGMSLETLSLYDKEGLVASLPQELVAQSRVGFEYQYQMICLAMQQKEAYDILMSRPILLALICHHYSYDNETALKLCRLGQKQILAELGFESSKSVLKFLSKLDLKDSSTNRFTLICQRITQGDPRYLTFRHYSVITYAALKLDQWFPMLTGSRLGKEISLQPLRAVRDRWPEFFDTVEMGRRLGVHNPLAVMKDLRSLEAIEQLHDRWTGRLNAHYNQTRLRPANADMPYPLQLKGLQNKHTNCVIEPILNYDEIVKEGRELAHCIASYHNRALQGRYCVFRMLSPERVTIGVQVRIGQKPKFTIDQIRGYKNSSVSYETRQLVIKWFRKVVGYASREIQFERREAS